MGIVRMTAEEARMRPAEVDRAKLDATTEEDIRRHIIEDGGDPDAPPRAGRWVIPAAMVRERLGLTQAAFAELIGVPVGTLRNWEQGRVRPDAAAQSLLAILWREPKAALRALRAA